MRYRARIMAALLATSAFGAFESDMAYAQQQGEGVSAGSGVGDIVVTARRREEFVQDVPLAVSALGGEQLEARGITNITEMNGNIVGVTVSQNPNGSGSQAPFFAIRGQAQQEVLGLVDPSVALYVDDIVVGRSNGANLGFFDLQSVEVARGPQGTLFGRNTTGGAVQVRTRKPTRDFEAYVSQLIGNYGHFATEAMINIPLGDALALRVAGQHVEKDGYLTDVVLDRKIDFVNQDAIRGSLTWTPAPDIEVFTTASYSDAKDGGPGAFVVYAPSALYGNAVERQRALQSIYKTYSGVPQYSRVENVNVTNVTSIDVSPAITIKNIFGYRKFDVDVLGDGDGTDLRIFPIQRLVKQNQISEEFQVQGTLGRLTFTTGLYYFRETVDDQNLSAGALTLGAAYYDPDPAVEPGSVLAYAPNYSNTWTVAHNKSYALYFQGDYALTDRLSVTLGLRQNWDKRRAQVRNRGFQPALSTTAQTCRFTLDQDNDPATAETRPALADCEYNGSTSFDELTYNLSVQYKPTDDMLLYAATRHGYRSGGFSARAPSQAGLSQPFRPEIVDDVELGAKADWHIGGMFLRTNLALYYAEFKDAQRILQVSAAPPVTTAANAQKARIQGSELEILFRPNDWLSLSTFWAHTDAKFVTFLTPVGVDLSPQMFPHVSRNTYSIGATLKLPVPADAGDLTASLRFYHQDRQDADDYYASPLFTDAGVAQTPAGAALAEANNAAQIIPGYSLLDFTLDWKAILGSRFDAALFVNNVTDKKYLLPNMRVNGVFESRTPGAPRTVGVKLRVNFR